MRGVIYARQSRYREESVSIPVQIEEAVKTAERLGIELMAEPLVDKVSGYKDRGRQRPEWRRLLTMLRDGATDCVIVYKSERLSRGGGPGWAPFFDACEAAGLDLDRAVVTPSGFMSEFEIGIRASMDREESKKLAGRMTDIRAREAKDGRPAFGGPRPFGFQADHVTHHLIEADQLRGAAQGILAGEATASAARRIGIPAYRLKRILRSPRVTGFREHRGTLYPADWEPILDGDLWEAVKAVLDQRGQATSEPGKVRARSLLLTGFLRCGLCDHSVTGSPVTSGKVENAAGRIKGIAGYRCGWCMKIRRAAEALEAHVRDELLRRFPLDVPRADVDPALAGAVHGFQARLAEATELWKAGVLDVKEYAAAKVDLESRLSEARRVLADAQDSLDPGPMHLVPTKGGVVEILSGEIAERRRRWDDLDLRQRRAMIAARIDRIVLHPAVRGRRFDSAAVEIFGVDGEVWQLLPALPRYLAPAEIADVVAGLYATAGLPEGSETWEETGGGAGSAGGSG